MNPVEATEHKDMFNDVGANTIFVMDKESAKNHWINAVDEKANSFFRLQDNNWLIAKNSAVIGAWRDAYNNDDNYYVSKLLNEHTRWEEESVVRFYVSKLIVLETKWKYFLKHWDDFLALEDDCPVLIQDGEEKSRALIFRANGDIVLVN
ncbi:hypothetical protein JL49_04165 [Pseudoalteromonas luteoviolacea]|nr:hypothetical protein JL49_04165 [Pseudoalteromonas luteoviolacea]